MSRPMEEEILEQIEYFLVKQASYRIPLPFIKSILILRYGKKSLIYNNLAKQFFEIYFSLIRTLGLGYYDINAQELILNPNNDKIVIMVEKNHITMK